MVVAVQGAHQAFGHTMRSGWHTKLKAACSKHWSVVSGVCWLQEPFLQRHGLQRPFPYPFSGPWEGLAG